MICRIRIAGNGEHVIHSLSVQRYLYRVVVIDGNALGHIVRMTVLDTDDLRYGGVKYCTVRTDIRDISGVVLNADIDNELCAILGCNSEIAAFRPIGDRTDIHSLKNAVGAMDSRATKIRGGCVSQTYS